VGQNVWAETLTGTFTIVAVHLDKSLADLQSTDGTDAIQRDVPFGLIHALGGDHSQTSRD
jgi:hypothetical protein